MPRDAYISNYGFGWISGFCKAQNDISKMLLGRPLQGEMPFYSSLFQAGLDRVVTDENISPGGVGIPARRVTSVSIAISRSIRSAVERRFESYLGPEWQSKPELEAVRSLSYFLADLMTSYHIRKPLLTPAPRPDLAPLRVLLPVEIFMPLERLFRSITSYESVVAVPNIVISRDQLAIIDEILISE